MADRQRGDAVEPRAWTARSTHRSVGATTNLRDLGGIPAGRDQMVAPSRVFRAEALVGPGTIPLCTVWETADTDAYRAMGVRTVIDLRSRAESLRAASAWPDATGAAYVALPIEEGGEGDTDYVREIRSGSRTRFTAADMAGYYAVTLRRRVAEWGAALRILTDPARLPVLVHCAAGKDRTGVVVALALAVAGVEQGVIVADYMATDERLEAIVERLARSRMYSRDVTSRPVRAHAPRAETMKAFLEQLDARYGGLGNWLDGHGFGAAEAGQLRAKLRQA
jgi:protein-tyrosine phosphatase